MSHSDDYTIWEGELPTIHDLYQFGGRPGCAYLYCDLAHLIEATQAGWRKIKDAPTFRVTGPKGTCDFELLESGTPAISIAPQSNACEVFVSDYLVAATGLGGESKLEPELEVATPAPLSLGQSVKVAKETSDVVHP